MESKLRGREAKGKGGEKKQPHEHMGMLRTSTEEGLKTPPQKCSAQKQKKVPKAPYFAARLLSLERETRFELATLTMARLCSTN